MISTPRLAALVLVAGAAFSQNTPKYPSSVATYDDVFLAATQADSVLTAAITSTSTSLPVVSSAQFRTPGAVTIDGESIKICSTTPTTLAVCSGGRGFQGTVAAWHRKGARVNQPLTSWYHNQLAAELLAVQTALGPNMQNIPAVQGAVSSVFGRTGAVTAQTGDYSFGQISGTVANSQIASGVDAAKIGGGTVSNTVFGYLAGVTGGIQAQLDLKAPKGAVLYADDYCSVPGVYDHTCINSAIAAASNFTTVQLSSRTYTVAAQVAIASKTGIVLRGVGQSTKIVAAGGLNAHVVKLDTCDRCAVEQLQIDGVKASQTAGYALYIADSAFVSVRSNYIHDGKDGGIKLTSGAVPQDETRIIDNYIQNNGGSGVEVADCNDHILLSNHIDYNGTAGVLLTGTYNVLVAYNNILSNGTHGVFVYGGGRNKVHGNLVRNNNAHGIVLQASNNNQVANNLCHMNSQGATGTYDGIAIDSTTATMVIGNTSVDIDFDPKHQAYGLYLSGTTDATQIIGNVFTPNLTGAAVLTGTYTARGNAGIADNTALGGDATGTVSASTVGKLQGRTVASTAPTSGQALVWNGTTSQWEPQNQSGTGTNATQLQGRDVAATAPSDGQALAWSAANNRWEPVTGAGSGVTSVFGRTGAVTAQTGDYSFSQINGTISDAQVGTGIDAAKIGSGVVSNTEYQALDGVTAAIQTQLDGKASSTHTHGFSAITGQVVNSQIATGVDAAKIGSGTVGNTVFGYLANVTSDIQTQINGKAATSHSHTVAGDVTGDLGSTSVAKVRGRNVATTAPTNGQVLVWNDSLAQWEPQNQSGTGTNATQIQSRDVASTAPTSGQALAWNVTNNRWEPTTISGSGGAGMAAQLGDLAVTRFSATVLQIGANCSTDTPCNVRFGNTVTKFTVAASVTLTSGSGTAFVYVMPGGTLTVGHNVTLTCSSCTAVSGVTGFPIGSIPLARWDAVSGSWATTGQDFRAVYSRMTMNTGDGLVMTDTGDAATVSVDTASVQLRVAVPASASSTCTEGQWARDANYRYECVAANTWKRVALSSW